MTGYPDDSFRPEALTSRREALMAILKGLEQSPVNQCTGEVYNDVRAGKVEDEACRYIEKFGGTLRGETDDLDSPSANKGVFRPGDPVTRAQMAVMFAVASGPRLSAGCTGTVFRDVNAVSVGDRDCRYIETLSLQGISLGCGGRDFCPDSHLTRAEVAELILAMRQRHMY